MIATANGSLSSCSVMLEWKGISATATSHRLGHVRTAAWDSLGTVSTGDLMTGARANALIPGWGGLSNLSQCQREGGLDLRWSSLR